VLLKKAQSIENKGLSFVPETGKLSNQIIRDLLLFTEI